MSRRSGSCLRCCLVIFAVISALCVSGPALYWRLKKGFNLKGGSSISCTPCICDCPPPLSLLKLAPGLANLSITDVNLFYKKFLKNTTTMIQNHVGFMQI
ncbi:Protein of unknown function DUF1068 [Cynara cardunculus var. scolymus]|uniref:Uncharacterized protein n=1 Tax=Cynara cardunculus var. scolymus TaxID=59895 RepID=A0A103XMZ1_CYNCS|nr:Protein of unknown function DUF1068 [Cynara cardunculus var. scolymus]